MMLCGPSQLSSVTAFIILAHMSAVPITSHTICQWYSRMASVIVAIVIVIENAIVLFYNQLRDSKYNNRKEIMLKMVTIFTMVNSLQEYSCEHTPTQFSTTFYDDISSTKYSYLRAQYIMAMIHQGQ